MMSSEPSPMVMRCDHLVESNRKFIELYLAKNLRVDLCIDCYEVLEHRLLVSFLKKIFQGEKYGR